MMRCPTNRTGQAGCCPIGRMIAYEPPTHAGARIPTDPLAQSCRAWPGPTCLASARNDAAVEHCRRANGGLYYANREEFVAGLRMLMTRSKLREQLGESGRQYVRQHYRWDAVLGRFERLITAVRHRA